MKKILLCVSILLHITLIAQRASVTAGVPVIKLIADKDTINALKKGDNGLRVVQLAFTVKTNKPDRTAVNMDLLNFNNIHSKPQLVNAEVIITSFAPTPDSNVWLGHAVCNILLMDTTTDDEKFFIVKKDDVSAGFSVVVHSLKTGTDEATVKPGDRKDPDMAQKPEQLKAEKKAPYHFDNAETEINPIYTNNKDSSRTETIKIRIRRDALIKADEVDTIEIAVEQNVFPYTIKVLEPFIIMDSTSWAGKTDTVIEVHIQNRGIADTLKGKEQVAYLKIKGDDKKTFHAIRLTERGLYNRTSPFWMETGANFDLLDGIKANNLYAGIYMFEKDIARIGNKSKGNNLGFIGGVYESKSSSLSTSSDSGLIYRDGTSYSPQYDTATRTNMYRYYRDTGSITTTTDVQSIGIFFSPHLRLTNKRAEENGFHVFLSAYLEMLWQRVNSNFDYKNLGRDSVFSVSGIDSIYQHPFKDDNVSSDYRSQYVGIGLPLYINDNSFSLYINNVVFGYCNQRFVAVQDSGLNKKRSNERQDILIKQGLITPYQNPKHSWNPFYLLQFRLTEEKYGIVFTGEVRGFYLQNSKPVISLALSKKFDLADLFHAVVKPFTPGL